MKLIVIAFALFVATIAYPTSEWEPPTAGDLEVAECIFSNHNLPIDQLMKCIRKCTLEKYGLFDETNGFNVENLIKVVMLYGRSESAAREVATKCAVKKEETESNCDWAGRGLDCFFTQKKIDIMEIFFGKKKQAVVG